MAAAVTTWRHFARREFPRVIRDLALPCATPRHDHTRCPVHDEPVGTVTRVCADCFHEAWDEVARRYADPDQGAGRKENR